MSSLPPPPPTGSRAVVKPEPVAPTATPLAGQKPAAGAVTPRAVIIALALLPLNAWWLIQIEYVRYSDNATTSALFFNASTLLLLFLAVNAGLKRVRPRWIFRPGELATIYLVIVVGTN